MKKKFRRKGYIFILVGAVLISFCLVRLIRTPLLGRYTYSREVLDRDGRLLRLTLSGDQKYRIFKSLTEISPSYIEAVLLKEDRHFRQHLGVNPVSLAKAAFNTYVKQMRRRGGSTITMQLARMMSTNPSKTIWGKVLQVIRACALEGLYSKDEILEAYLNLLPYGANVEGVGAASRIYFGRESSQLSIAESLTLAVIPQNPNSRHLELVQLNTQISSLKIAREKLLEAWLVVYPEDQDIAASFRIGLEAKKISDLPFKAPHFVELALARSVSPDFRKNSRVRTTLDSSLQELLESKINAFIKSKSSIGVSNGAALILNHETMEVLAQVGSANYFDNEISGQVNGSLAKRSPGSVLKPFVYGLAIEQGLIHPMSLLKDTPISFGGFDPENFDHHFSGPLSATEALVKSRNVPAVYLTSMLNKPSLYDFLKQSEVAGLKDASFYGLSISLGGAELTMEEVARLYAMLANHGLKKPLKYFLSDSNLISASRLLSSEASFLALDMLSKNRRDGRSDFWLRDLFPVAWKTGTSHGYRDAWTVGVVGPFVVAVWLGNFDNEGNVAFIGRDLAAPLFFNIVDGVKPMVRNDHLWHSPAGLNLKKVSACSLSGFLPGKNCQHRIETWFIPGISPIATCAIHRKIFISKRTGLRMCDEAATFDSKSVIHEFWPSDLLQVFQLAGVPRRPPPAFEASCGVEHTQNGGLAPQIKSPKADVMYNLRVSTQNKDSDNQIPFTAVSDGDAQELHWFVDTQYLGKVDPFHPLIWKPVPGKHLVRVVDNLGRSDSREVLVQVSK